MTLTRSRRRHHRHSPGRQAEGAALSGAGRLRIRVPSNLEPVPVEPDRCGGKQRDGQGIRQHALHLRGPFHVVTCFERRYPLGQQSPRDYSFSPSGEPIKNRERGARRHPAVFRNWSGSDGARRDLRLPGIAPAVFLRTGATGSAYGRVLSATFSDSHARACPAHPRLSSFETPKTWLAGSSPAMTSRKVITCLTRYHLFRTDLPVVPTCRRRIRLRRRANQKHFSARPASARGAFRDRHGRWKRDAMDAHGRADERGRSGRRSRVGLISRR